MSLHTTTSEKLNLLKNRAIKNRKIIESQVLNDESSQIINNNFSDLENEIYAIITNEGRD